MSATIFTGWHLLTYGTATNIIFVGAAVLVLRSKVRESRDYMAAGDAAFAQAEQRDAAFEETRNKPWYWPTGPAIEADKPHDAEVLHVAYPTQELRLVADDPQVAAGLSALADEVGLVQALSDRPAADEDEVGDEQPGEARWFRLRFIAATLLFPFAWLAFKAGPAVEYVADKWAEFQQTRRERNDVGTGERSIAVDPFEQFRIDDSPRGRGNGIAEVLTASGYELDIADEDELQVEMEAWKAANPPTNPQPYTGRHWVSDVQHTSAWPLVIPKPRDGEVQS